MRPLEARLQAVADLLGRCRCVADIGTDHGYLPIYLIETRQVDRVIASDVSVSALRRAQINTCAYEQIETRLSDGFARIAAGECDAAVIAGVGGNTLAEILRAGSASVPVLVLQPMGYVDRVRRTLGALGYGVTAEKLVCEGRRFYFIIRAEAGRGYADLSDEEAAFGPCLLRARDPELLRFLDRELTRFRRHSGRTRELDPLLQYYEEVKSKWFAR